MARPPRLHLAGGCYHVTLRGNHREPLFASAADRAKLDYVVADAIGRFDARVHAFCWMTNHLHVLVQVGAAPLGSVVKSIATRYARYRHTALETSGHLFERRYGARLIDVDAYFLAVLRYIHLNPVKAQLVGDPAEYPWSSHRAYMGHESRAWVTTDFGLSLLGRNLSSARIAYARLVACSDDAQDKVIETGYGPNTRDARILGDDDYCSRLGVRPSTPSERDELSDIASQVCDRHGVALSLLRSRASSHSLTPIRIELLTKAVEAGVASLTEVARFLGRAPSTLSRQWQAAHDRSPENAKTQ